MLKKGTFLLLCSSGTNLSLENWMSWLCLFYSAYNKSFAIFFGDNIVQFWSQVIGKCKPWRAPRMLFSSLRYTFCLPGLLLFWVKRLLPSNVIGQFCPTTHMWSTLQGCMIEPTHAELNFCYKQNISLLSSLFHLAIIASDLVRPNWKGALTSWPQNPLHQILIPPQLGDWAFHWSKLFPILHSWYEYLKK